MTDGRWSHVWWHLTKVEEISEQPTKQTGTYGSNSWMTLSNRNTENSLVENAVQKKRKKKVISQVTFIYIAHLNTTVDSKRITLGEVRVGQNS